jgi:mannose-6-phosphate isomerase-like protein (cupin superfamily)
MSILFLGNVALSTDSFEGTEHGGIAASVIFVDMAPGEGPKLHQHPYPEIFFILEGESTFTDGVTERVVGAGEVVIASEDQPHAFINTGSGRLRQIDIHLSPEFITEWLEPR